MGFSVFESTSYGKVDILSEKIKRRQWWGNKFAECVAPNYVKSVGKDIAVRNPGEPPALTGAPIELFEEFVKDGQMDMRIPVMVRLTGMPTHGDRPLEGQEEDQKLAWRSASINRTRKAVAKPTGMSRQLTKGYADYLVTQASNSITTWFGEDYHPGNFILATLAGYSRDLLVAAGGAGGRGLGIKSHPNFLVAGDGFVSYTNGRPYTTAYEAAVAAACDGLADQASDYFSADLIENAVLEAYRRKITPLVTLAGTPFHLIFCSDAQIKQLRKDPDYLDWVKNMPEDLKKHPLGKAAEVYLGGALIIPDLKLWGVRSHADDSNVTDGTVEYGPAATAALRGAGIKVGNWINTLDTSNKKLAILMGKSALSVCVGEKMKLKENVRDYENVQGIGIDTIESVVRNDIFDQDGGIPDENGNILSAGSFLENTSSMVIASYSPHKFKYSN